MLSAAAIAFAPFSLIWFPNKLICFKLLFALNKAASGSAAWSLSWPSPVAELKSILVILVFRWRNSNSRVAALASIRVPLKLRLLILVFTAKADDNDRNPSSPNLLDHKSTVVILLLIASASLNAVIPSSKIPLLFNLILFSVLFVRSTRASHFAPISPNLITGQIELSNAFVHC